MRGKLGIAVLISLWGGAAPVLAQGVYPTEMSIIVPKVEARSGPSMQYYPTSELRQGDRVVVVGDCKEQPGWLEIKPPPGSFSWIDSKSVRLANDKTGVIDVPTGTSVPVRVGSSLINKEPTVTKTPGFVAGHIVTVVDKSLTTGGVTWLPVQPHPKEVRYIPADAVRPAQVATNSPANWAQPGAKSASPAAMPGYPSQPANAQRPVQGSTTSFSPSPSVPATNPQSPQTYAPQWSAYGVLRQTTFTKDGQPMYVLVDRQERPLLYVTHQPGKSLRSYVGRTVAFYGQIVYRPDEYVRMHYMVASQVAVPPNAP
jgi:uncharacterized protein YraI